MNDLTDHADRHAGKNITLDEATPETCTATAWHAGKHRQCLKPHDHDGHHKARGFTWRPRSGEAR